jgi:dipeptidase
VTDDKGKSVISPLANPFMPYDANKLFRINGGWGELGERTIARWYTMYATIIQCRDFLPDPVGGLVWLAMDNVATSVYIPVYCGVTDMPEPYKVDGRMEGFSNKSAWWAFNRLGTLTAQRWGDMRHDVEKVWNPIQQELFDSQKNFEKQAVQMLQQDPAKGRAFLTGYTGQWGSYVVGKAWKLGDYLWTKYDEKF